MSSPPYCRRCCRCSSSSLCHHCCHCPHAQLLCRHHRSCRKLLGCCWTSTRSILLINLVSSATLIIINIIVYGRQWLSHNKLPPLVGYVLAGERAANIAVWITPAAAKSICGIFLLAKIAILCGVWPANCHPFFKNSQQKWRPMCSRIQWWMGLQSLRALAFDDGWGYKVLESVQFDLSIEIEHIKVGIRLFKLAKITGLQSTIW